MSDLPFADPPDSPETVTAALQLTGRSAARISIQGRTVRKVAAELPAVWRGRDADAAITDLSALGSLLQDTASALQSATEALDRYRAVLARVQTETAALRGRYENAIQDRELRSQRAVAHLSPGAPQEMRTARTGPIAAQAQVELDSLAGRYEAASSDVQAAARRLAGALSAAADVLHVDGAPTPLGVTQLFAATLPLWGRPEAERAAQAAAAAVDPQQYPYQLRAVLQRYAGWATNPAFSAAFLRDVGATRFGALLAGTVPVLYNEDQQPTLDAIYGLLGPILAAGTRVEPDRRWLRSFLDSDSNDLRIGLGLALRHGDYGADALDILIPPLLAHPGDPGINVRQPMGDPLVGAMSALSRNPVAARRILDDRDRLTVLLHRAWREDDGKSLGAALAATATGDPPDLLMEPVVDAIGADPDAVPLGVAGGLGQFLGINIEAVNQSLLNNEDVSLPHIGSGRRLDHRVRLANTLFVAMHSGTGSAAIYAHQTAYAGALIQHGRNLDATLDGVVANYGRLAGIHQRAIVDLADRADSADEADANADTWLSMARFAVGLLPLPAKIANPVTGTAAGMAVGKVASKLQDELYTKPLARRKGARHAVAGRLINEELAASEDFSIRLIEHAYPDGAPSLSRDLSLKTVLHQAGLSGQADVARVLLPSRPTS